MNKEIDKMTIVLSSTQQENIFLNNELSKLKDEVNKNGEELARDWNKKKVGFEEKIAFLKKTLDFKEALIMDKEEKIKVLDD